MRWAPLSHMVNRRYVIKTKCLFRRNVLVASLRDPTCSLQVHIGQCLVGAFNCAISSVLGEWISCPMVLLFRLFVNPR